VSGFVTDSEGNEQVVKFSRPAEIEIYVAVEIVKDPLVYPTDGDDQIKAAIATVRHVSGKDVVASRLVAACFTVDGVLDAAVDIGDAPDPSSSATIEISLREIAVLDTSRVDVSSTNGVP
jgi:hypothetical protein